MKITPRHTEEALSAFTPYGAPVVVRRGYELIRTHHLRSNADINLLALGPTVPLLESKITDVTPGIDPTIYLTGLLFLIETDGQQTLYYHEIDHRQAMNFFNFDPMDNNILELKLKLHLEMRNYEDDSTMVNVDIVGKVNRLTGAARLDTRCDAKDPEFAELVDAVGFDLDYATREYQKEPPRKLVG
jgi:hypothetical protein